MNFFWPIISTKYNVTQPKRRIEKWNSNDTERLHRHRIRIWVLDSSKDNFLYLFLCCFFISTLFYYFKRKEKR